MKSIATLLLLFPLLLYGQGVTQLADWNIYRGNPSASFPVKLLDADSSAIVVAKHYTEKGGRLLQSSLQPSQSRVGRVLTISWSAAQTLDLPDRSWVVVTAGGLVRAQVWVNVSRNASQTSSPSAPILLPGDPSFTTKTYPLQNVLYSGFPINHGKGTRRVTATFFREDTGQIDALWRIEIIDANTIMARGPLGETFTGELQLLFYLTLSN